MLVFIKQLYYFIQIGVILVLWVRFFKTSRALQWLTIYATTMGVIETLNKGLSSLGIHNLFLSHFYFTFQFLLLSGFYYTLLEKGKQRRWIQIMIPVMLLLNAVPYAIHPQLFHDFNPVEIYLLSMPIIVYATWHLYQMLDGDKTFYYFTLGVVLYVMGSAALFLAHFLMVKIAYDFPFWLISGFNLFLYTVFQIFMAYQVYQLYKINYGTNVE
jgi:hypothetical protein